MRHTLLPIALFLLMVLMVPTLAGAAPAVQLATMSPAARSIPVRLSVVPNPVRLRNQITVSLSGVQPGVSISFRATPMSIKGFGGGNMGTRRANRAGVIRFRYPAFTLKWEVGRWSITAYAAQDKKIASVALTVITRQPGDKRGPSRWRGQSL